MALTQYIILFSIIEEPDFGTSDPPSECPMAPENCISGNETIIDKNNDTCMALNTKKDNRRFNFLATISSECIQTNGTVFLDMITFNKTSCSLIKSKIFTKIERLVCMNNITLIECNLIDIGLKSTCRVRCKCMKDLPCQLWFESANFGEQFNIVK